LCTTVLEALNVFNLQFILLFFSSFFSEDVMTIWNFENSIEQYQSYGGTSKASILQQIENLKQMLG